MGDITVADSITFDGTATSEAYIEHVRPGREVHVKARRDLTIRTDYAGSQAQKLRFETGGTELGWASRTRTRVKGVLLDTDVTDGRIDCDAAQSIEITSPADATVSSNRKLVLGVAIRSGQRDATIRVAHAGSNALRVTAAMGAAKFYDDIEFGGKLDCSDEGVVTQRVTSTPSSNFGNGDARVYSSGGNERFYVCYGGTWRHIDLG